MAALWDRLRQLSFEKTRVAVHNGLGVGLRTWDISLKMVGQTRPSSHYHCVSDRDFFPGKTLLSIDAWVSVWLQLDGLRSMDATLYNGNCLPFLSNIDVATCLRKVLVLLFWDFNWDFQVLVYWNALELHVLITTSHMFTANAHRAAALFFDYLERSLHPWSLNITRCNVLGRYCLLTGNSVSIFSIG